MKSSPRNDSLEILIGDLIFKLGKANQQIHSLSQRLAQLEQNLQQKPTADQFSLSRMKTHEKQIIAQ